MTWDGLTMAWRGRTMTRRGIIMTWDGLTMAWRGLTMTRRGIIMAWCGLIITLNLDGDLKKKNLFFLFECLFIGHHMDFIF
jgi:hypothetical protein